MYAKYIHISINIILIYSESCYGSLTIIEKFQYALHIFCPFCYISNGVCYFRRYFYALVIIKIFSSTEPLPIFSSTKPLAIFPPNFLFFTSTVKTRGKHFKWSVYKIRWNFFPFFFNPLHNIDFRWFDIDTLLDMWSSHGQIQCEKRINYVNP